MGLTSLLSAVISGLQNNTRNTVSACGEGLYLLCQVRFTVRLCLFLLFQQSEHLKAAIPSSAFQPQKCSSLPYSSPDSIYNSGVCCKKRNKGGQRSHSSSTCVQVRQFREQNTTEAAQHWNYRAAHERLMAQQLLFSLSCIYASRSGNSIYNHRSYVEDFFFFLIQAAAAAR